MNSKQTSRNSIRSRSVAFWASAVAFAGALIGSSWSLAGAADQPGQSQSAARMIAEAKPTIDAANNDWFPAMRARDAKRVVAPYADDGIFVTRAGQVVSGRAAIEHMYETRFAQGDPVVSGKIVEDGLAAAGVCLVEWGHATFETEHAGVRKAAVGHFLTLWCRNADAWQIERNLTF